MRGILTYHSIDAKRSPISLDEAAFARHVAWLARSGAAARLADLLAAPAGRDRVALTFDDAYSSFAAVAWPRLREHGLPATVFVVSGHAGGTNVWGGAPEHGIPVLPLCDWDELGRLAEEGVELGVHSRTHPHLVGRSPAELEDELAGAKADVLRETGAVCTSFAYPYGSHDAAAVEAVRARFERAVTTQMRLVVEGEDAHLLPRLDAHYLRPPGRLEAFGRPAFERWVARRRALRALGGRVRAALGRGPVLPG